MTRMFCYSVKNPDKRVNLFCYNELPASVVDGTTKNDKDKNLQNIDLLYCDNLDCKRTFM